MVTEVPTGPAVGSRTIAGVLPPGVGCWASPGLSLKMKIVPAMRATKIVVQIITVTVVAILMLIGFEAS
jgi:hypothetical protein